MAEADAPAAAGAEGAPAALLVRVAGRAPHPVMVRAIAFVVGAASLGTEIAAARLLAPYFGASTIIWANTIATVLVALSAGYWLGGRLADRRADLRGLCAGRARRVAAAGARAVRRRPVPAAVGQRPGLAHRSGGSLGSLVAVLVLVAVPVMLLGTVAPYASRLSVQRVSETGRTIGNLYAISTVGSLVGTFLAALLLIPTIGTHRTFIVFALSLALVAVAGVRAWRWLGRCRSSSARRWPFRRPAIGAGVAGGRVIFSAETEYQYARVVQFPGRRALAAAQRGRRRPLAVPARDVPHRRLLGRLPGAAVRGADRTPAPPRRIAILGDAAGTRGARLRALLPGDRASTRSSSTAS